MNQYFTSPQDQTASVLWSQCSCGDNLPLRPLTWSCVLAPLIRNKKLCPHIYRQTRWHWLLSSNTFSGHQFTNQQKVWAMCRAFPGNRKSICTSFSRAVSWVFVAFWKKETRKKDFNPDSRALLDQQSFLQESATQSAKWSQDVRFTSTNTPSNFKSMKTYLDAVVLQHRRSTFLRTSRVIWETQSGKPGQVKRDIARKHGTKH